MITIIDYNAGNIKSVQNALAQIGEKSCVTQNPTDIINADKIIFPGVGAAKQAMKNLKKLKLIDPIKRYINKGRPFLGICLGAQILLETSEEGNVKCLGIIKGSVKKFNPKNMVVPHMGWNQINIKRNSKLMRNIENNSFFYFIHSYYLKPKSNDVIIAETNYNITFTSIIQKGNVWAVQFHPEKSAANGLNLLKNFTQL